jgi:hypothetical protein
MSEQSNREVVYVGRPTKWGNPYIVVELSEDEREGDGRAWRVLSPEGSQVSCEFLSKSDAAQCAVEWFREAIVDPVLSYEPDFFEPLRGKDLCCWCPVGQPCHADVLLEIANDGQA